jgi:hypothetical protein
MDSASELSSAAEALVVLKVCLADADGTSEVVSNQVASLDLSADRAFAHAETLGDFLDASVGLRRRRHGHLTARAEEVFGDVVLPPEKWSSVRYGF